jgi:tRNA (guanine37-N1)-methyltransferase
MIINVLTLFPEMIEPVVNSSIIGRAQSNGQLSIRLLNIRDFTLDKHKKTDDTPFGGGAGMVLSPEPVFNAFKSIGANDKRILYMSPKGRLLDQDIVFDLACEEELVILCGHYEGIDERIINYWNIEEISIGDYILTGGEIPALTLIDAVVRMLPEVLGSPESHNEESIYSGLLEYPHYTKPRSYNGLDVPEVLVSGNHKLIHLWQFEQSLIITKQRRPDLFEKFCADLSECTKDERKIAERIFAGSTNEK